MERKKNITIRKVKIDRFSVTSSKPFEMIVAALEVAIWHPGDVEFMKAIQDALTFSELERAIYRSLGRTGVMMFMRPDHGAILRKETWLDTPKVVRF
jgi:hypothetical protein